MSLLRGEKLENRRNFIFYKNTYLKINKNIDMQISKEEPETAVKAQG